MTTLEWHLSNGNVVTATRMVLEASRRQPADPSGFALQLKKLASQEDAVGALKNHHELIDGTRELLKTARLAPNACERLWSEAEILVGAAHFPVVGGGVSLRRIDVHDGCGNSSQVVDAHFDGALANAFRLLREFAGRMADRLETVEFLIAPHLPTNGELMGSSVGLAAFVSLSSWLFDVKPRRSAAYSGVIRGSRLVAPEFGLLDDKLRAIGERGYLDGLAVPGYADGGACLAGRIWKLPSSPRELLGEVFGSSALAQIEAKVSRHRESHVSSQRGSELELRTHTIVSAAHPWPVTFAVLADALSQWDSDGPSALYGQRVEDAVSRLMAQGEIAKTEDKSLILASPPLSDIARSARAHLSLVLEGSPLRDRVAHLWLGGKEIEAIATFRDCSEDDRRNHTVLDIAHAIEVRAGTGCTGRFLVAVAGPQSGHELARLAWLASKLTGPFARLAHRFSGCSTLGERLAWVQAVYELLMHLALAEGIAKLGLVTVEAMAGAGAGNLSARPNVGDLARTVLSLGRTTGAPSLARRLAGPAVAAAIEEAPQHLNKWLHGTGSWARLLVAQPDEFAEPLASLTLALATVLEELAFGGELLRLGLVRADGSVTPVLNGIEALPADVSEYALGLGPDAPWTPLGRLVVPGDEEDVRAMAFYRGTSMSALRWWSFCGEDVVTAPAPDGTDLGRLFWNGGVPSAPRPASRRLPCEPPELAPIERLQQPVARAAALLRGRPGERASPAAMLSAIDLAVSFSLRLPWFAWWLANGDRERPHEYGAWLPRMTKRNLLEAMTKAAASRSPIGCLAPLFESGTPELLEQLVLWLERAEHTPGPFDMNYVRHGAGLVETFLARSARATGATALVGRTPGGGLVSLQSTMNESVSGEGPSERGGVELVHGGRRWSLGPLAMCEDRDVVLLVEAGGRNHLPLLRHKPMFGRVRFRGKLDVWKGTWP
jgi:hypothetical protein